jgi:hypothetical protein
MDDLTWIKNPGGDWDSERHGMASGIPNGFAQLLPQLSLLSTKWTPIYSNAINTYTVAFK